MIRSTLGLLLILLITVSGCTRGTDSFSSAKELRTEQKTIAISFLSSENPFFSQVTETIREQARGQGYRVVMEDAQDNSDLQTRQVRHFIEREVDAIVLIPCNSKRIGPVVRQANNANIPVFTADVAIQDPVAKIVCHVATDNYAGGKVAAEQIVEAVNKKGKIAIVDHPAIESVQLRIRGFREVIAFLNNEGANVSLVTSMPAYGTRENAKKTMREILNDHPDLDAVFAINDPTAFGILDVLRERGLERKIKIVSFDGSPEAKRLVDQGLIYSDIVQLPIEIGKVTFEQVHRYLTSQTFSSQVLIPISIYSVKLKEKEKIQ